MAGSWFTVTPAARAALEQHTRCDGHRVTVTAQLDPGTWRQVSGVMERLGGTYVPNASTFALPPGTDAAAAVAQALAAGRVMAPAGAQGYVPTPMDLAEDLVASYAELPGPALQTLRVLEPSAGTGRFVSVLLGYHDVQVTAVEPDTVRASQIPDSPRVTTVPSTFEEYAATGPGKFDRVVMNPPFSVPGRAALWAEHLLLAWRLLAPGGRLVAILPASALHEQQRGPDAKQAAALIADHGRGTLIDPDAFAPSGTTVRTCVVRLDRLPARPADQAPVRVDRPFLTRAAALHMPAQLWTEAWTRTDLIMRSRGACTACGLPTWLFENDGNDPRGALGRHSACWSLRACDYGQHGPDVVLCADCGNDGDTYRSALELARRVWGRAATRQEPAAGQLSLLDLAGADR